MNRILIAFMCMTLAVPIVEEFAYRAFAGTNQAQGISEVANETLPPSAAIREILVQRIDAMHRGVGIVVGVIDAHGRRIVSYGHLNQGDDRPLNGDTMFEIGSATKVFTSLLLSEMVQRGEVALDDPVAKFLPSNVKVPERNGKQITLIDLSTHTSGLPRMPTNFAPIDPSNPYLDYSVEDLYEFLSSYQLTRDIGSDFEYSNLGGGLLGLALSRRAGLDYGALVHQRICDPLGMNSTRVTLTADMKARRAVGHSAALKPVPNWEFGQSFAGAGALRSDANDMLTFLAANLGYVKTPLAPAMAAMLKVRRPTGTPALQIGLGWLILTKDGQEIVWHDGGTGGYRSFVGFEPNHRVGVVVLSNAGTPEGVDDIGVHLLDAKSPLWTPPSTHKEIHVDPAILGGYVGDYAIRPNFVIRITRNGDYLYAQATGQEKAEIYPESDKQFFLKVVDAEITFVTDNQGHATALVLDQGGISQPAPRVEGAAAAMAPKDYTEAHVDPEIFSRYVGTYRLTPTLSITITREGDHLFAQTKINNSSQAAPKFEILPSSQTDFFYKLVDAQITFVTSGQVPATELILRQGAAVFHGKRIE